jgi:hypothetical protein
MENIFYGKHTGYFGRRSTQMYGKIHAQFAFQDLFLVKRMYGPVDDLLETMRSWGIEQVEFLDTRHSERTTTRVAATKAQSMAARSLVASRQDWQRRTQL